MAKLIFNLFFVALFISSNLTAQDSSSTVKVKVISYRDIVKGHEIPSTKGKNFISPDEVKDKLKSIPTLILPAKLVEKLKNIPANKLITITKKQLETIPLIDGKRTISYKDLIQLGRKDAGLPDLPYEHCIGDAICSCQCYGFTLWIIYVPGAVCTCNCFPGVGIMIICEDPCYSVWAGCAE